MQLVLLLLFGWICLQSAQSQPGEASLWQGAPLGLTLGGCAVLTWGAVIFSWFSADFLARWYAWRLTRSAWPHAGVMQRFQRARRLHTGALFAGFLMLLTVLGWGRFVEDAWSWQLRLLGAELVMLGPLLAALLLSWERFYRVEKLVAETEL